MTKKNYILDTSVYLSDAMSIYSFKNNDIIIPLKVLEEIDRHKGRQDGVGTNARQIIRILDSLRSQGNLNKGVKLGKGKGYAYARSFKSELVPKDYDITIPDNQIIATALTTKEKEPSKKVIVVSNDINMRVKCDAIGLPSEDYQINQLVKDTESIYTGFTTHLVDEQTIDQFYEGKEIVLEKEDLIAYPNQFIMLVSNSNEKKTALAKFVDYKKALVKVNGAFNKKGIWGVSPRNKEQAFAADLLMDPDVQVLSLIGKAGSGKTLLALAAALAQIMDSGDSKTRRYKRLIVSRPIQPMGRDIGFLPGSMEEKMAPWIAPIQDNLQFLMGNDRETVQMYVDNGTIEIEALTYIRGRSISNAFIIVDEAQNLTTHELKTIITRVGEDTKIILTGDIEQIDNVYIDETTNGLTYAIEKFKEYDLAGHITLIKGERSKVATLASKIL